MLKLRKFLSRAFGALAYVFLFASAGTVPRLFRGFHSHHPSPGPAATTLWLGVLSAVLIVLSKLLLALPLPLGISYGMAWWTWKRGLAVARIWAVAASILMLLLCIPQFVTAFYVVSYGSFDNYAGFLAGMLVLTGTMMTVGILGLVAFGRRDAVVPAFAKPIKPPRIAGDGTSGFLDGIALFIGSAGFIGGMRYWAHWGRANDLPFALGMSLIGQLVVALLLSTASHEAGHAIAGVALGMKLRSFLVGPFQWRIRDGKWNFKFTPTKLFSAGGAVGAVPTNPHQSRWIDIGMIAAGPLANLLTGLVALGLALTAKGRAYQAAWWMFALVATLGLVGFFLNLLPLNPEGLYSDGANIYQLLKGGPWADLHKALSIITSTAVTPLRPMDYDIEAIHRAAQYFTEGRQGVLLRLFASSYYLDRGELAAAREAITEAESVYEKSAWDMPAGLCMAFAFRIAFLRRDALRARQWWDRVEANKPRVNADYWLAKSALLFSENRLEEAREAWKQGSVLATQLPAAGDYEFDRYLCSLLGRALDEASVVS